MKGKWEKAVDEPEGSAEVDESARCWGKKNETNKGR